MTPESMRALADDLLVWMHDMRDINQVVCASRLRRKIDEKIGGRI